ncbi:PREDICTED: uncharacterized protein LOC104590204 isoform X2 [Nelumbo nucifera]|uniref:Uncharacterized protein LOC104590204 isoform X2 n=2 Tax=Nelumbo nucifera TaxID=4432 RepID=A0A1U7ZHH5_NELNU|nr:PREDICTED: uncharacterized protein LOC104590204 isoform X2 [Nelumbo nucifera]DAD24003.1 TPA_asm: hypothetical protein HUJ06_025466 [Nelumbo nucifera]
MAYIPPHKRNVKDADRPSPTPDVLVPQFERNLTLKSSKYNSEKRKDKHSSQVRLEPVSCESIERKNGEKPLVLVCAHPPKEFNETTGNSRRSPWVSIAQMIQPHLLTSYRSVWNEMEFHESEEIKPSFVARFGKILLHGSPSVTLDNVKRSLADESTSSRVKRSFYTNLPSSYMEGILGNVAPNIGVDFDEEKEYYHVKVFDKSRPDTTISCKCTALKGGELELHKIELSAVRHLVADISCLEKNLDLRLMLYTKVTLTALTDDEKLSLSHLIKSAIIDPNVKGGLRWPLGKECFGDKYSVVGAWHTKAKAFKNLYMKLKVRDADRFDFRTSMGEFSREVGLKMTGIVGQLQDHMAEVGPVTDMLQDTLKLIWDNFLSCNDLPFS